MKKLVLFFAVVAAVSFASCNKAKTEAPAADATEVAADTVAAVDTAAVAADTVAAPVAE